MAAAGSGQRFASRGVRAQHAPLPLSLRRGAGGRKRKAGDALLAPDGASRKAPRGGALLASVRDSLLLAQLRLAALYQVPPRPAARSSRRAASRARCQNFTCSAQALQACAAPRSLALLSSSTRAAHAPRARALQRPSRRRARAQALACALPWRRAPPLPARAPPQAGRDNDATPFLGAGDRAAARDPPCFARRAPLCPPSATAAPPLPPARPGGFVGGPAVLPRRTTSAPAGLLAALEEAGSAAGARRPDWAARGAGMARSPTALPGAGEAPARWLPGARDAPGAAAGACAALEPGGPGRAPECMGARLPHRPPLPTRHAAGPLRPSTVGGCVPAGGAAPGDQRTWRPGHALLAIMCRRQVIAWPSAPRRLLKQRVLGRAVPHMRSRASVLRGQAGPLVIRAPGARRARAGARPGAPAQRGGRLRRRGQRARLQRGRRAAARAPQQLRRTAGAPGCRPLFTSPVPATHAREC